MARSSDRVVSTPQAASTAASTSSCTSMRSPRYEVYSVRTPTCAASARRLTALLPQLVGVLVGADDRAEERRYELYLRQAVTLDGLRVLVHAAHVLSDVAVLEEQLAQSLGATGFAAERHRCLLGLVLA